MICIANSELVFKMKDKLKRMFMDIKVLSKIKRLDCRVGYNRIVYVGDCK